MRHPMKKGFSADSAVSVFSSEPNELIEKCDENFLTVNPKKDSPRFRDNRLVLSAHISRFRVSRFFSSTNSSTTSMEYDDTFELYSDEERSRRRIAITSHRKLGENIESVFLYSISFSVATPSKSLHLQRKDLTFDDPYIVPIPGASRYALGFMIVFCFQRLLIRKHRMMWKIVQCMALFPVL